MAVDDVFPRRNLPGDPETGQSAEPWGRAVEDRVVETQRGVQVVSQELAGLNRSTASSLGSISDQIQALALQQADLAGRTSYSTSSTASQSYSGVSNPIASYTAFGPTLNFTLDRTRVVSVTSTVLADIGGNANSSGSFFSIGLYLRSYVDGSLTPNSSETPIVVTGSYASGSVAKTGSAYQNILSRSLVTLSAGAHTLRAGILGTVSLTGAGGAFGSASNPLLFVDVLQPA